MLEWLTTQPLWLVLSMAALAASIVMYGLAGLGGLLGVYAQCVTGGFVETPDEPCEF